MWGRIFGNGDGPTAVFIAGKIGFHWLNLFGLIIVILILLPNIIYAIRFKDVKGRKQNMVMVILEQAGRYASMFLMVFNIGIAEFGFASVGAFDLYLLGNVILLLLYWLIWFLYFVKQERWKSMALAVIPTMLFLLSGITLRHILLVISAVIFGVGHIYITWRSAEKEGR